jgi:DNA-binding NtrC family response regulator
MPPLGRVLVVDDEPDVAGVLRDAMIDFGYEVETALTAFDALTLAPLYRPDVVLLDLFMPGISGPLHSNASTKMIQPSRSSSSAATNISRARRWPMARSTTSKSRSI